VYTVAEKHVPISSFFDQCVCWRGCPVLCTFKGTLGRARTRRHQCKHRQVQLTKNVYADTQHCKFMNDRGRTSWAHTHSSLDMGISKMHKCTNTSSQLFWPLSRPSHTRKCACVLRQACLLRYLCTCACWPPLVRVAPTVAGAFAPTEVWRLCGLLHEKLCP
jgi:hypothetical protein